MLNKTVCTYKNKNVCNCIHDSKFHKLFIHEKSFTPEVRVCNCTHEAISVRFLRFFFGNSILTGSWVDIIYEE